MNTIQKLLIILVVISLTLGAIGMAVKPASQLASQAQPILTRFIASVAWLEMAADEGAIPLAWGGWLPRFEPNVAWNS